MGSIKRIKTLRRNAPWAYAETNKHMFQFSHSGKGIIAQKQKHVSNVVQNNRLAHSKRRERECRQRIAAVLAAKNTKKGNVQMGFLKKLFGKKKEKEHDSKPTIYGGDGTSINDLAIVNCASPQMAYAIIDNFISKRHGKNEDDWNEGMRLINSDDYGKSNVREIAVELKDGNTISYFFDVSRSMEFASLMAQMVTKES